MKPVHVIGGGLAGSACAHVLAQMQVPCLLYEMRPSHTTPAHQGSDLAELVCSNSFRSDDASGNAVGLLHEEMRLAGSLIMLAADRTRLPAGGALAVDRQRFAKQVTEALINEKLIEIRRQHLSEWPVEAWDSVIIATGPLTSDELAQAIIGKGGAENLSFYDAIAPIIYADSIDISCGWWQSRYDKGASQDEQRAYFNCPLTEEEYGCFVEAIIAAPKHNPHEWEREAPYFEGCLPIEIMAARGHDTLRYGPMKPVGLTNPHNPQQKPYAVIQLRKENRLGTLYNMVGMQTKMLHAEQKRVFRTVPALAEACFARLGGVHRNIFINSPQMLDASLRFNADKRVRFAGQITGVEGYIESAAIGWLSGYFAAVERYDLPPSLPPPETAHGALLAHITSGADSKTFQPMNINFGLFPPLEASNKGRKGKRERARHYCRRALDAWEKWLAKEVRPLFRR